jgi:hypothetical protein
MPITPILQKLDGALRMSSLEDAHGGLNRCLPFGNSDADQSTLELFPLLQHVDAYCDVLFTQSQMPQLLEELDLLMNRASDQESRSILEKVRELAVQYRDSNDLDLRFVGD